MEAHIVIALLSFFVLLPQFIYWKAITGSWLFNSYVGERFTLITSMFLRVYSATEKAGWSIRLS